MSKLVPTQSPVTMMRLPLISAIALSLNFSLSGISVAQAEPLIERPANKQTKLPPPRGNPDNTDQAVTRSVGACGQSVFPLTPIIPATNAATDERFFGNTLTGHPTFWFYIPDTPQTADSGEFLLEDEQGRAMWKVNFKLPEKAGLVKVTLPQTERPLDKNKQYRWYLYVYCNPPESPNARSIYSTGIIQRLDDPALENQLNVATVEEKLSVYANRSLWYDATTNLPQIRQSRQGLKFLKSFGLEPLSREEISGSIVPTTRNR